MSPSQHDPADTDSPRHTRSTEGVGAHRRERDGTLPTDSEADHEDDPTAAAGEDAMPPEGATILDADRETLGTVTRILGDYVQLQMDSDDARRWFPRAQLTAAGTATMFTRADAAARAVPAPDRYEASQYIDPALRTDDEDRQREHMLQELADQRRALRDGDALPDAERTVGRPVEEELGLAEDSTVAAFEATRPSTAPPAAAARPASMPRTTPESRPGAATDGDANAVQKAVRSAFDALPGGKRIENALRGSWLGHPLHPALTDAVTAGLTMAVVFDTLDPKNEKGIGKAADVSIAWALAWTLPTALAGAADYQSARGRARRVGLLHVLANTTSTVFSVLSLLARGRGSRGVGRIWGLLALTAVNVGAYLGGELVFDQGMSGEASENSSESLAA